MPSDCLFKRKRKRGREAWNEHAEQKKKTRQASPDVNYPIFLWITTLLLLNSIVRIHTLSRAHTYICTHHAYFCNLPFIHVCGALHVFQFNWIESLLVRWWVSSVLHTHTFTCTSRHMYIHVYVHEVNEALRCWVPREVKWGVTVKFNYLFMRKGGTEKTKEKLKPKKGIEIPDAPI